MKKIKELKNKLFSLPKAKLIPILIVGVVVAGIAGAATVPYVSNLISKMSKVDSPTVLTLYGENGNKWNNTDTEVTLPTEGGSTIRFSKIIKNNSNNPIPMAVALVIRDVDMNNVSEVYDEEGKVIESYPELTVTSAGPCGDGQNYTHKCVDTGTGVPYTWDSLCWCQNEGVNWYTHGQCSAPGIGGVSYDDTKVVWWNGHEYSVILFGGTFDSNGKVINSGWGTPTECKQNATGTPVKVAPGGYDTGKVKVTFAPNLTPGTYYLRMRVIMPGSTISQIIDSAF